MPRRERALLLVQTPALAGCWLEDSGKTGTRTTLQRDHFHLFHCAARHWVEDVAFLQKQGLAPRRASETQRGRAA